MAFRDIDECAAREFFAMLQDAPPIRELEDRYPGVDNVMHVLTAQLAIFFVLPFIEGKLPCDDLAEAFRRYLYTAFALGMVMRDNDRATRYVQDLYSRGGESDPGTGD